MTMSARIRRIALSALFTTGLLGAPFAHAADPAPAASPDEKTVTTASGLQYVDTKIGTGAVPKAGQTVSIQYTITAGGKRVEGSSPAQPFEFKLGHEQAMKAIDEGVSTMKVGGQRKLLVPPALGYGTEGVPGKVPPNATMQIDIELVAIK
jgi:FKBP-type peptidyl-prolyl cis-trans isomerase